MPRAHITSVQAIDDFRATLIIYISKARPALDEVTDEVRRIQSWLQHDQRLFWDNQLRRRSKQFEEAQQTLFSSRVTNPGQLSTAQANAQRARRALARP